MDIIGPVSPQGTRYDRQAVVMKRPLTVAKKRKLLEAAQVAEFKPVTSTELVPLTNQMDVGVFTSIGWQRPDALSDEAWTRAGITLVTIERATPWWWGDWWLARETRALPPRWRGPDRKTLDNYRVVAKAFAFPDRRELVPFSHHAELTSANAGERQAMLSWSEQEAPTLAEFRTERRRRSGAKPAPKTATSEQFVRGLLAAVEQTEVEEQLTAEAAPVLEELTATAKVAARALRADLEPETTIVSREVLVHIPVDLLAWAQQTADRMNTDLGDWIVKLLEQERLMIRVACGDIEMVAAV